MTSTRGAVPSRGAGVVNDLMGRLRAGSVDVDQAIAQLAEFPDEAHRALDATRAAMLCRLHQRSNDLEATRTLRVTATTKERLRAHAENPATGARESRPRGRAVPVSRRSGREQNWVPFAIGILVVVALLGVVWSLFVSMLFIVLAVVCGLLAIGVARWTKRPRERTTGRTAREVRHDEAASRQQEPMGPAVARFRVKDLLAVTQDGATGHTVRARSDTDTATHVITARAGDDRVEVRASPDPPSHSGLTPRRLVDALRVAIGVSLLWLLAHHVGWWQFVLAVLVAVAVLAWEPASRAASSRWRRVPATALATIPLLALLNVLVGLALLDVAAESFEMWSTPTVIAFSAMVCVNAAIARSVLWPPTDDDRFQVPPNYVEVPHAGDVPAVAPSDNGHQAERQHDARHARDRFRTVAIAITAAAAAAWIAFAHPGGPILVLIVLVVGAAIPFTTDITRDQAIKMVLAVGVGVATLDYVGWRFSVTNWSGAWIAVPLLWAEVFGAVHVLGFQFTIWPRTPPEIAAREDVATHPVFLFVPTVNEGPAVLRPTVEGCLATRAKYLAEYPHANVTIVICNDGRVAGASCWEEIEALARELDVRCVTRTEAGGAKAGNIEHARRELDVTGAALLAIFDADQVPEPDFLLATIPPFADTSIGWVQTGQYYANSENPVSRWADDQQSMFYNLLCPGKAALNSAFICGTNVVIRGAALDEIGGLPQNSVTEDFAASIRLHPRWRSIYLSEVLATGLGPLDMPSYLKQQRRWALGTLGVFRAHWRDIFLPKKRGLRFGQRVQYFLACTHYLCGIRDLLFILIPILFVFTGVPALRSATLADYLWHFLPYGILAIAAMWYSTRGVTGLRGVVIGFGSFPALLGSFVAAALGRKSTFTVTSKARQRARPVRYLWIYGVFVALCLICLIWATRVHPEHEASLFISLLWVGYSLLLLLSFLWLARADLRLSRSARRAADDTLSTAKLPYSSKLLSHPTGLKPVWCLSVAAMLAVPLLVNTKVGSLPVFEHRDAPAFALPTEDFGVQYAGLSLPVQLLHKAPARLQNELGVHFSIIGRTQEIRDNFDRGWASQLAAQGARPWVTLQFGVFGPNHKVPLGANLPAIVNGLRDDDIARWATEIRDFGQPVYVTVLLHADRNWAVSSGVAHGGIPEDVPKAWLHVQSIFRSVGANNVAWVWAPADPIHDREYAPPTSSIDAVLQSFINFPGTTWGDPQHVLEDLGRRYPDKPLFIEASAAGPAAEKAAWLGDLAAAVRASPHVYAVLYHEGGPDLAPSAAVVKQWSMASDLQSLTAAKRLVAGLRTQSGLGLG